MKNGSASNQFSESGGHVMQRDVPKCASLLHRSIVPNSASQTRVAFSSILSNTGCKLAWRTADDLSTSEVAVCCCERFAQFVQQPGVLNRDDGLAWRNY